MTTKQIKSSRLIIPVIGILFILGVYFLFNLISKNSKSNKSSAKGILALNTDKSGYLPGDKMTISMASLDESGHTICNSNLGLEITDPGNIKSNLEIANSPSCGDDNVTNDPDYTASKILEKTGKYKLVMRNLDTNKIVETIVTVNESFSFEVTRSGATRINPSKSDRYPMIITVKANRDYKGQIKEHIPDNFKIVWQGDAKIEGLNLVWDVDIKAGETKTFPYEYQTPQIDPKLYKLGPINVNNQNTDNFWQIVTTK
jgi:hypothetical protein